MPPGRPRKKAGDALIRSAEMIGWALGGIEREIGQTKERLVALTTHAARLRARLGHGRAATSAVEAAPAAKGPVAAKGRKRRKMSAEARKRISELMRKRWAETKKAGKRKLQAAR